MVDTNFTLVSGTYADEQDLLGELDFFLTQTIQGWTQVKVVTDTASDKNIAYYSDGSEPGFYDRFWLRIRATSNELRFNGASLFNPDTDTDSDVFGGGDNETELPTGTSGGEYWFMANKDAVHIVVDRLDSSSRHGGFGLWDSYFDELEDPKPFYVFGQTAQSQKFTSFRLISYGPHSWGTSYSTLGSGVERAYEAPHPADIALGTPNPRSGEPKIVEPVFYADGTFRYYEVRGEVPGLYMCGGTGFDFSDLVTIESTLGTTSGTYFWYKHTDDVCWAIGPVTVSGEV